MGATESSASDAVRQPGMDLGGRVARPLPALPPIPADEALHVHEADDLGVEVEAIDLEADDRHDASDLVVEELPSDPGLVAFLPIPKPRSLIPADILESIAQEEEDVLHDGASSEPSSASVSELDDSDVVTESTDVADVVERLRRTEVLRNLTDEAIAALATDVLRHRFTPGQIACRDGDLAESFFVVETGQMEGFCGDLTLQRLEPGQPFGLFGLLSRNTRMASVRAITPATVLEIPAAKLDALVRRDGVARQTFARFFKERLLENFLTTNPLFSQLDSLARATLLSNFQDRRCLAGEVLVAPGEVSNGIYLVTSGALTAHRRSSPGREVELACVERGEFLAIFSGLTGCPVRAQVVAAQNTTLCWISHKAFNEVVKGYPTLRSVSSRLASAGTLVDRDILAGDGAAMGG